MASASSIKAGSAYVELLLNDSRFIKGLDKAAAKFRAFGSFVSGIGARITAAASAIFSALTGTTGVFSKMGDELAKASKRTGITVETLSELAYAADLSGADLQTLERSIARMQRTLGDAVDGTTMAVDALSALGLTVSDLMGKSPDEQFKLIADRIAAIEDPTLRAAAAMDIFGRSGTKLIPLMLEGADGIAALQEEARRLGLTMSGEDAHAAEVLNDTFDRLWKVIKRTTFVIGAALAPTIERAATFITNLIVSVNDWINANRQIVLSALKITAIILGVGIALVGLGGLITALGLAIAGITTIVGAVGSAFAVMGSILAAILSPIGLVITAIVALGAYLLYVSDVGSKALAWLGDRFTELKNFAVSSFGGIADALAAGDIGLAAQILWLTLRVAFVKGVGWLQSIWLAFSGVFIQTAYDAFYGALAAWEFVQHGLTVLWIETTAFLSKLWTNFTGSFMQAWNDAVNWTTKRLLELQGLFDSSLDVEAAKKLADQDLDSTNQQIEEEKQKALAEREQDRQAQRDIETQQHEAEKQRIGQESIDREKALDEANAAKVKAAEEALARAKEELRIAIEQAREERSIKESEAPDRADGPPSLMDQLDLASLAIEQAHKQTISVSGTFNALEARGLGAGGVTDRIARASEETAKNTKRLLDEVQNQSEAEFD